MIMINLSTVRLAGIIMVVGILAIAGTNLAFAQNATSAPTNTAPTNTTPTGTVDYPCAATAFYGAQAYAYIACTPLGTAQMEGLIMTGVVVAFSIGCAAGSGNLRH
jgi:hypothetical protein